MSTDPLENDRFGGLVATKCPDLLPKPTRRDGLLDSPQPYSEQGNGNHGERRTVKAIIAFLLLIVMLAIGACVHGVRQSRWKFLAFATACVVVLALLLAILAQ